MFPDSTPHPRKGISEPRGLVQRRGELLIAQEPELLSWEPTMLAEH